MLPNQPIEGNQDAGGQTAKTDPSATPSQPSAVDYAKVIQDLQRTQAAQEATIRALQSEKDKRWATEVEPMKDQVARLAEALGLDESQVKKAQIEMALSDLAEAYMDESQVEPSSDGTGDGEDHSAELKDIMAALELPANDPRVTDLITEHGNDVARFSLEASKLKLSLNTAQITPAELPGPSGRPSTNQPETDAQKRERIFGPPSKGIFDEATAYSQGGGAFVSGRKIEKK
jgi:hypothetical protein